MPVQYGRDLSQFPLKRLQAAIEAGDLLPSHRILADRVAERFAALEALGITHLQALIDALKTKKKLARFAADSGLPEDYLTILRRKANSYVPNPAKLADIPDVDPAHAEQLAALGIKHTQHLFERALTPADRAALAAESGVPADAILDLVKLADIVRAGYVGPVYARMIVQAGAETLADLAAQDPPAFYARLLTVNAERSYTKASFTLKDITITIESARELPPLVEY